MSAVKRCHVTPTIALSLTTSVAKLTESLTRQEIILRQVQEQLHNIRAKLDKR